MELTAVYIFSQVFVIISYLLLIITYYSKDRKTILILSFAALITTGMEYVLLSAYTGMTMVIVAIIRNSIFIYDEKVRGKSTQITKRDVIILIVLYAMIIAFAIVAYDGVLSLLTVFSSLIYTFSVWQKKTIVYKILGVPTELLEILYSIYIMSIFEIIFGIILTISAFAGVAIELNKKTGEVAEIL